MVIFFFYYSFYLCGQKNETSYVFNKDIFYLLYFQVWYVDRFCCFGHLFEEIWSWQWISLIYILLDFRYFMAFLWKFIKSATNVFWTGILLIILVFSDSNDEKVIKRRAKIVTCRIFMDIYRMIAMTFFFCWQESFMMLKWVSRLFEMMIGNVVALIESMCFSISAGCHVRK